MRFCDLLSAYRKNKGLSKTELAEKLGVTPEYIINVENGQTKRPPTIERCRHIANILSLSPKETRTFINTAIEERLPQEVMAWFIDQIQELDKYKEVFTDEIWAAVNDQESLDALLTSFRKKKAKK